MEQKVAAFLNGHDDFVLICHVSPDGDTLGSALALYHALCGAGKQVQIACEDAVPEVYHFLPHAAEVVTPDLARPAKTAVAVDCADVLRTGACETLFSSAKDTLNIDHHGTNIGYALTNDVQRVAATGELIYQTLCAMEIPIDREIATCLYTALSTDTGNFSYSNTTPDTFRIMAELMEIGIDLPELNRILFRSSPARKVRLRARAVEKMLLRSDGRLAVSALTISDFTECGASAEDNEGVIDALRDIDTVEVAALLRECADGTVRVSLRGKRVAAVNTVAVLHGGGGHRFAAGCTLTGTAQKAQETLLPELEQLVGEAFA